jgi:hypothetical protein
MRVTQVQLDKLFALLSAVKAGEASATEAIQHLLGSPHWVWGHSIPSQAAKAHRRLHGGDGLERAATGLAEGRIRETKGRLVDSVLRGAPRACETNRTQPSAHPGSQAL